MIEEITLHFRQVKPGAQTLFTCERFDVWKREVIENFLSHRRWALDFYLVIQWFRWGGVDVPFLPRENGNYLAISSLNLCWPAAPGPRGFEVSGHFMPSESRRACVEGHAGSPSCDAAAN